MTLPEYLALMRGNASDLARKLGVSHSTVLRWASGKCEPSLVMLDRIQKETRGKVKVADLVKQATERAAAGRQDRAA